MPALQSPQTGSDLAPLAARTTSRRTSILGLLLLLRDLLGKDLLHALLLLDQEGAKDAIPDASTALDAAIRSGHMALALLQALPVVRPGRSDDMELVATFTTFDILSHLLDALQDVPATRSLHDIDLVTLGVVVAMLAVGETLHHDSAWSLIDKAKLERRSL